mgnify:CR=1 FL=1
MKKQYKHLSEGLKPIFNSNSSILILGSFPSVKSREGNSYYGHPQNRFWGVMEKLYNTNISDKEEFLLSHQIALWDVVESCDIIGSSDSSIKNVKINDILRIINSSNINKIYTNGKVAHRLFNKYLSQYTDLEDICLPSTSPANAVYNFDKLIDCWQIIKE